MFKINLTYLINILLPPSLRKQTQISWLKVLLSYFQTIYDIFLTYRYEKLYDINFSGQTMYLEKKLQDTFNCSAIFISDGYIIENTILYNKNELSIPTFFYNQSENLANIYMYNEIEQLSFQNFVINIPLLDYENFTEAEFSRLDKIVNYYKLADKNYIIKFYE